MTSVDGFDSFITFMDDYSRYGYIYPIREKSEALEKFKIFKAEVENQDKSSKVGPWRGVLRSTNPIWPSS